MTEWQPIETAPKDTEVLLFDKNDEPTIFVGKWFTWGAEEGCWVYSDQALADISDQANPTHWMPLPPPPSTDQ